MASTANTSSTPPVSTPAAANSAPVKSFKDLEVEERRTEINGLLIGAGIRRDKGNLILLPKGFSKANAADLRKQLTLANETIQRRTQELQNLIDNNQKVLAQRQLILLPSKKAIEALKKAHESIEEGLIQLKNKKNAFANLQKKISEVIKAIDKVPEKPTKVEPKKPSSKPKPAKPSPSSPSADPVLTLPPLVDKKTLIQGFWVAALAVGAIASAYLFLGKESTSSKP